MLSARFRLPAALLFTLALAACGAPSRPGPDDDATPTADAGDAPNDASTADTDAGDPGGPDASDDAFDAGTPDPVDAGSPDPDPVDAGSPDPDPIDAGSPDPIDAGSPAVALTVTLTNARNNAGRTCIAVFADAASFPDNAAGAVFNRCFTSVNGPFTVDGLVDGTTYGLSAFHDANQNSVLDTTNVFGAQVPNEGYGFSNNPSAGFGAPSWDQVKFVFNAASPTMSVRFNYVL